MASCSLWQGAIVRRCRSYAPYPFDLDAIRKLSPRSLRSCHEHASRVYGGKTEHGDDGFAVEQSIGSDRHDRPGVRVARLACARKRHPSVSFRGRKAGETCQKSGGFHQQRALRRALPAPCTWRPRAACKHKARSTAPRLSDGSPFFPRSLPELMKTTRFLAGPPSKLHTQQKGTQKNEPAPANRTSPRRCETSARSRICPATKQRSCPTPVPLPLAKLAKQHANLLNNLLKRLASCKKRRWPIWTMACSVA